MLHRLCLCPRTLHVTPPSPTPQPLPLGDTLNVAMGDVGVHSDGRYLTEIGKVDIYWTGSRLTQLSSIIPPVGKNISRQAVVPWRYHFNTGTSPSLTYWKMIADGSYVLVYYGMVDLGRMGEYVRLDGSPWN